jgi:hypothetical protein
MRPAPPSTLRPFGQVTVCDFSVVLPAALVAVWRVRPGSADAADCVTI